MASGYRDYSDDAVGRIGFIHCGQAAVLTLAQIRQILRIREHGQAPCSHVRDLLGERLRELDAQIAELLALRKIITQLRAQAAEPEPDTCSADEVSRYV